MSPRPAAWLIRPRFTGYDLTTGGEPRPVGTTALLGTTALRIDHYVRTAEYVILLSAEGSQPVSSGAAGTGSAPNATRS